MNCRDLHGGRWLGRTLGAILVLTTSYPGPVAGSDDVAVLAPTTPALSQGKIVGALVEDVAAQTSGNVDVVVSYDTLQAAQEDIPAFITGYASQTDKPSYAALPFRDMSVPVDSLVKLASMPGVRYVTRDSEVTSFSSVARATARVPGSSGALWSSNTGYAGQGVTVAVVDTGVANHPDFYNLAAEFDFVNGAHGAPIARQDGFGHGTHVAGMVGGTGANSTAGKYRGVSTSARVVALRVLDGQGRGQISDVIAALDWILTVGIPQYNVRVANLSLGKGVDSPQAQDALVQAVDAVWDAGVVVVVSAGNYGDSGHFTITSPGNSRKVITVGSVSDNGTGSLWDDTVSTFSSRGPTLFDHVLKPDILAPGNRIMAPFAEGSTIGTMVTSDRIVCGVNCTNRYLRLSGTSMAAGLVSGAVTRMLQKDPSLNNNTVKARLMKTARKVGGDPTTTGAGVLDVDAAMNTSGTLAPSVRALSPVMQLSADGLVTYVEDPAVLWGSSQWSAGYLWANGFLWTNASPLGVNGFLWSESYLWSNSVAWANSFLWSNGFLWSEAVNPSSIDVEDPAEPEEE
jgi:serine protease AprX